MRRSCPGHGARESPLPHGQERPGANERIRQRRALAYDSVPITETILQRAIEVQGELARGGRHRIPIPDLIIAAAAESSGLTLLHYDHDYDLIGEITGQPTEWVVERGTV